MLPVGLVQSSLCVLEMSRSGLWGGGVDGVMVGQLTFLKDQVRSQVPKGTEGSCA